MLCTFNPLCHLQHTYCIFGKRSHTGVRLIHNAAAVGHFLCLSLWSHLAFWIVLLKVRVLSLSLSVSHHTLLPSSSSKPFSCYPGPTHHLSVLWGKLSPPASFCSWTPLPITFIYLLKSIFVLSPVMPHRNIIHHINSATSWQMSHFSLYSSITLNNDSYNSTFLSTATFLLR